MTTRRILALALLLSSALPSCRSEAATRISVTGSSTVAPLFAEIAKRFEARHPGTRIDVQTGGSTRGATDARRGLAHIGMMSRNLNATEKDLTSWPIAVDGLCMITHADNPVATLTQDQVQRIYRGEIRNWLDVGGQDRQIVVVHKAEGRATLDLFLEFFELDNPAIRPDVVVGDNEQGIKTVIGAPGALGYVSIGAAAHHVAEGAPLRLLSLENVPATLESVGAGRWPLMRNLIVVTKAAPRGAVRELIDFARSEAVHDLVRSLSFTPIQP